MTLRLLRNLGESTRFLILRETSVRHHAVQRTIAEAVGITVQGVSEYLRAMEEDGLIQVVGGEYRPTMDGIRMLHERFRELRDFVDRTAAGLAVIDVTAAFAGNRIERGGTVGLFMRDGELVAYAGRKSPSTGRALRAAEKGEDVAVGDLEGIVALIPGRISLLRVPSAADGGSRRIDPTRVRGALRRANADVVGAIDVPAKALARRLRLRVDIRFGAVPAAIEAAERGLSVALLVSEDRVAQVVAAIEEANARTEVKIPYETATGP